MGVGLRIGIGNWGLGWGIGDWGSGSVVEIAMGLELAIGDLDLDGGLVLGIRIGLGIGNCEFGIGSEYWGLGWD